MMLKLCKFDETARKIQRLHFNQTVEDFQALNEKYTKEAVLGEIDLWDAITKLDQIIDPTDKKLKDVTQWTHTLQVIDAMEKDHASDEVIVAGWLHDLGKLLLIKEKPENVVCLNEIIQGKEGAGLENCTQNWNHDEFVYLRFKNLVDPNLSWLMRYHSIKDECFKYMSNNDKALCDKYLFSFQKYDRHSKSSHIPTIDLERHRRLLEKFFPTKVWI